METKDFFYHLPEELIAQTPLPERNHSRLLYVKPHKNSLHYKETHFYNLPQLLKEVFPIPPLIIKNNSKVFPARFLICRETGAQGEVFLLEYPKIQNNQTLIRCLLRPQRRMRIGETLRASRDGKELFVIENLEPPLVRPLLPLDILQKHYGIIPLPPYIIRPQDKSETFTEIDRERYQTVYATEVGSVAAPTAGLHFTEETIENCKKIGANFADVTLHVSLGTFQPVHAQNIEEHNMHEEYFVIPPATAAILSQAISHNRPIVFVGTTSFRAVESYFRYLIWIHTQQHNISSLNLEAIDPSIFLQYEIQVDSSKLIELLPLCEKYAGQWLKTQLFIRPRDKHSLVRPIVGNALLTNFHQPESTLAMLIAALMGYPQWQDIYTYAISKRFRFLSYGDASLLHFAPH